MAVAIKTQTLSIVTGDGETIMDLAEMQGTWTAEQYLRITESTNRLIEFTDGSLEVLSMPSLGHQRISRFLLHALEAFVIPRGGEVLYSPFRLRIREDKFREPDLLLVLDANDPRLQDAFGHGADLVIEIVSPDNPERDIVIKRVDYAEAGIPEYWIVYPEEETITVLRLENDQYTEYDVFRRGDTVSSVLLAGFTVSVNEVLNAGRRKS